MTSNDESEELRAAKERIEVPDYAELGYQETEVTDAICGVEEMRYSVDLFLGTVMGDIQERLDRMLATDKENQDDIEKG